MVVQLENARCRAALRRSVSRFGGTTPRSFSPLHTVTTGRVGLRRGRTEARSSSRPAFGSVLNGVISWVSMTTVGYGDITPQHPLSRTFSALQTLIAQFFLITAVARLVALQITQETDRGASSRKD